MEVSTQVLLTIPQADKKVLWGILHHHLKDMDLDEEEKVFVSKSLTALDPEKYFEKWYTDKKGGRP